MPLVIDLAHALSWRDALAVCAVVIAAAVLWVFAWRHEPQVSEDDEPSDCTVCGKTCPRSRMVFDPDATCPECMGGSS
jgi:hypothetical protein